MRAWRDLGIVVLCWTLASASIGAQTSATESRVAALVGLARTARDQGHRESAAAYFRDADRLRPFTGPLLVEYFWAAHAARTPEAALVGERALAANPRDARVRDGLIGLAVAAGSEDQAAWLAEQGRTLDPAAALWPRRLGESHLRTGHYRLGAGQFLVASTASGAEEADLAQMAFCLELTGDKLAAAQAWRDVPETLWSSRIDWTESRARAAAPAPAPPVRRAAAPARTDAQIVSDQLRRLAAHPCASEPLAILEQRGNGEAFVAAIAARPTDCPQHGDWASRAVERLIADGAFDRAIAMARPVAALEGSPPAVREQLGVLLHWIGSDREAEPVLRDVVSADPAQMRATTALIEVLRAKGDSDAAWSLADVAWRHSGEAEPRIGLAELALETGRLAEALALARALEQDDLIGGRAAAVEGAALLALGHPVEALRVLEPLLPAANASLTWIDALAATEGLLSALAAADILPVRAHPAWADVNARRAVWHGRLGHRVEADRWLADVEAVDPIRGALTRAQLALATGRPIDAETAFRGVLAAHPGDLRALDGLSTALAEQGRWGDALPIVAQLKERRPSEVRWIVREAEWRYRQAPAPETLRALETAVEAHPGPESFSALARAYFAGGQFERSAAVLRTSPSLAENDRVLLARSLRAQGRTADALAALTAPGTSTLDGLFLRAELEAAVGGPAAADRIFEELTARPEVDPAWFLAWADLQRGSADLVRVLQAASARFPDHALIQERLAVSAWARGDRETAAAAARRATAADASRTGAWFVEIELVSSAADRAVTVMPLLDRFEARFGPDAHARVGMAEMLAGLSRAADDPATERAMRWMDDALARDAKNTPAAVARARLLVAQGHTERALSAVDELVAHTPEMPAALKLRAELLGVSGRYAESVSAYDRYLAVAPDDLAARRQQARIEGWRGAFEASRDRYAQLRDEQPHAEVIVAESAAKQAYYSGRWGEAVKRYDQWLALDPNDVEAQLERAQLSDRLGRPQAAVEGFRAVSASATPNDVAHSAAERIDRRRQASVDVFATGVSADAAARQQLLDLVDSGAGVSDDLGLGYGTRARLFGGPSFAQGADDRWYGSHLGMQVSSALASSMRATGTLAYRKLDTIDGAWFGDLGVAWRLGSRWRTSVGAERSLILENQSTLTSGLSGTGPIASVRWTPGIDFLLSASGSGSSLSDGNQRQTLRVSASQRVLRGANELRLVGIADGLAFSEARATYFTPSSFWRFDAGTEWRGWLAMPRFFGDRERWVSAAYLFGVDDRRVRYNTLRAGLSYEVSGGVAIVADLQATRSAVYNAGRVSLGVRLKQVTVPEP